MVFEELRSYRRRREEERLRIEGSRAQVALFYPGKGAGGEILDTGGEHSLSNLSVLLPATEHQELELVVGDGAKGYDTVTTGRSRFVFIEYQNFPPPIHPQRIKPSESLNLPLISCFMPSKRIDIAFLQSRDSHLTHIFTLQLAR